MRMMVEQIADPNEEEPPSSLRKTLSRAYQAIVSPFKLFREVADDPDLGGPLLFLATIGLSSFLTSFVGWSKLRIEEKSDVTSPPISWLLFNSGVEVFWSLLTPIFIYTSYIFLFQITRARGQSKKAFFSAFGYGYFPIVILHVITLVFTSSLPTLVVPKDVKWEDFQQIYSGWRSSLAYVVMRFSNPVFYFWQLYLSTLAAHLSYKVSWKVSIVASIIIFLETSLILSWPVDLIRTIRSVITR